MSPGSPSRVRVDSEKRPFSLSCAPRRRRRRRRRMGGGERRKRERGGRAREEGRRSMSVFKHAW
eukprot:2281614-Rhodomonas_salina.2